MNMKRALQTNATIKPDAYYFEQKKDETIKDFSQSISFGMTFLFSFFMAGLTGYYFGLYFIGLEFQQVLIVLYLVHDRGCYFYHGDHRHRNYLVHYQARQG